MAKYTERAAGVYPAKFVKLDENYEITDRETKEQVIRWRWVFQDVNDPTTAGELDTLSSPGFRPRSNGLKFLTGMLGGPPPADFDTDTLLGQVFDVTYGPNQNGTLTVTSVTRRRGTPSPEAIPTPVAAGLPPVDTTPPGDLPW